MLYFLIVGNYERLWHGFAMSFIFVTFELIAGTLQLLAALILDSKGQKFKYFILLPLYVIFLDGQSIDDNHDFYTSHEGLFW